MLPVLLLVPRLAGPPGAFSMLGYGDVVLPGLLLVRPGCAAELGCQAGTSPMVPQYQLSG